MAKTPPELSPRTVKPRKPTGSRLPVIAIYGDEVLHETGEVESKQALFDRFLSLKPSLFVKLMGADMVAELTEIYGTHPRWQWKATANEREIVHANKVRLATRLTVCVHFFGLRQDPIRKEGSCFHQVLDPVTFYGRELDEVMPGDEPQIVRLLKLGVTLRDWAADNRYTFKPSMGGIALQVLRDTRFYPEARRKVPRVINDRVREHLPGNHYELHAVQHIDVEYKAYYLDQRRAHHYHAYHTALPDANHLYAYGDFRECEQLAYSRDWSNDFHGLLCVGLEGALPPRWAIPIRDTGKCFVYSNELSFLRDVGLAVTGIYAAWGSFRRDTGIRKIAAWANAELDRTDNAPWLKPLLLATYGCLAARPKVPQPVFYRATHGEPVTLFGSRQRLAGWLTGPKNGRKLEPGVANVLHRGMIEAATRAESLGFAEHLTFAGYRVLAVYADAVIIDHDGSTELPLLPEPWRLQATLNHLKFLNSQAFVSGEMVKLPGITGAERKRISGLTPPRPKKPLYEAVTGRRVR